MARRKPYTKVEKSNQVRASHVKGMGDVVYKGFQCLNPDCKQMIFVRNDELYGLFSVKCEKCGKKVVSGAESKFYDYKLVETPKNKVIEKGKFSILHDDYVAEAQLYKYCIVCNTMKPIEYFDKHSVRTSGHQGECRLCKKVYNGIKNQTRIADQHREAAQKRRLYLDLASEKKIDSQAILKRFGYKCFRCSKDLSGVTDVRERPIDHTLPALFLWPLTTETGTLLCREHNAEKAGKWPSEFYLPSELRKLAVVTGIPYDTLAGPPHFNPSAMAHLKTVGAVDDMLQKYGAYMDEIIRLRNRILRGTKYDIFTNSKHISPRWVREANAALGGGKTK